MQRRVNAGESDSRSFADWIAGRCNSAPSRTPSRCLKSVLDLAAFFGCQVGDTSRPDV